MTTTKLTRQQATVELARKMGWHKEDCADRIKGADQAYWAWCNDGGSQFVHWVASWNPFTSIADAFEVQAALPVDSQRIYAQQLVGLLCDSWTEPLEKLWRVADATPAQRARAACQTWGICEDVE